MEDHYYTVGQLLEYIKEHNIPLDAKIYMQRVEDYYFDKRGWTTKNMPGHFYHSQLELIERAKPGGELHNKEDYPLITPEHIEGILSTENDLESYKERYYKCWCPVYYKDEKHLFLDAHY